MHNKIMTNARLARCKMYLCREREIERERKEIIIIFKTLSETKNQEKEKKNSSSVISIVHRMVMIITMQ